MKPILRAAYALLHSLARTPGVGSIIGRWLRPVTVHEVITSGVVASGELFGPSTAITSRVQEFGADFVTPDVEPFPAVGWRVVGNAHAVGTRQFTYLVHGNQMMIGPRRNRGPWQVAKRGNHVVWQSRLNALVNISRGKTVTVDGAVLLGGHSHTNWYHWLVDALPQLHSASFLPEPYRSWPVVVPDDIFRYPTMVEALTVLLDGRDIIRVPLGTRISGLMCWIDSLEISNIPESLSQTDPTALIHLLHREGMESYRQVFLDRFGGTPSPWGERIFITRTGTRRAYNQDEIADVAAEFGFVAVAPEKLSLEQQVTLFSGATHIIGPSGAGFAGLLFSSPQTKVLCWQDSRLNYMTILPDLATLTGSDYWHIFYEPDDNGRVFTGNYRLDPDHIRETIQAFVSPRS